MLAIALGLGSSLSWGVADFLGGVASRRFALLWVLGISQAVGLALVGTAALLAGEGPAHGQQVALGAVSALAGVGGLAAFYRGLAVGAMSVVAPISATAGAIPVLAGVAYGERPGALQLAGMVLALAGIVLAARERSEAGSARGLAAGAGFALLAALGFGSFFVVIDRASEDGVLWALLANRLTGATLLAALLLTLRPPAGFGGRDRGLLVSIGVFDVSANALFAAASTQGLVSVVGVCSSLYPVVTVLLARAFLGERVHGVQLAGVALALTGVAALGAGA